jgi:hypothetical protein
MMKNHVVLPSEYVLLEFYPESKGARKVSLWEKWLFRVTNPDQERSIAGRPEITR